MHTKVQKVGDPRGWLAAAVKIPTCWNSRNRVTASLRQACGGHTALGNVVHTAQSTNGATKSAVAPRLRA